MPKELTLRGLVLGALITTIFTAANVYLGLKVGLTFASSIPAAVISMAILSRVRDSSILENNIVQTVASAAGTLSAIIFVLPGLVIVGWWVGFPFWTSCLVCVAGGILGEVTRQLRLRGSGELWRVCLQVGTHEKWDRYFSVRLRVCLPAAAVIFSPISVIL